MNKLYYYIKDTHTINSWKISNVNGFFFFDEYNDLIKSRHTLKTIDQLKLILEYND